MAFAFPRFGRTAELRAFVDESKWHLCRTPFFAKRTIDGGKTGGMGKTWRRKTVNGWEYRQDAETLEEFEARQY
ncbi:hypothetical protein [Rhizobium sp. 007]|uniref:hypothetical protein n=1 Tax=Rhizobium sp. 007 TaxID=2785056 RepID=UPI0018908350|nr:hypothetical protein [Rhizobium sp. 007]QPB21753.1 hypothetical protein ISN39_10160 [Rhizobium sp. 007]